MELRDHGVQQEALDVLVMVRGILEGCWRYRWPAIAVACVLCLIGWGIVLFLPDVYRADARIYIDTESTLKPLLEGLTVDTDVMNEVELMATALLSQENLEKVVAGTELERKFGDSPKQKEIVINQMRASIGVNMDRNGVMEISYEYTNPQVTVEVVRRMVEQFIKGSRGEKEADAKSAQAFLEQKLAEYEKRLNDAEEKLADFKRRNVGMMPGEEGDYYSRLQLAMQRLDDLSAKLRLARQRRDDLKRQIEGEEPVFGLVTPQTSAGSTPLDGQIAAYERQLAQLRLQYTDTHPDVVQVLSVLEGLRKERERILSQRSVGNTRNPGSLDTNPVYQQMKMQLSQAEIDVSQLAAERRDQAAAVASLREKVDTIPGIEAELKRLTRNYDVTREQYEQLLQRLESARLSEAADSTKNDVAFRVIDPPTLAPHPVGPNRPLLLTAVLVISLMIGFGLAFLLNLAKPVFNSAQGLEHWYGVTVLGTVSLFRTPQQVAADRRNLVMLIAVIILLLAAYAVMLVFGGAGSQLVVHLMKGLAL